MPADRIQAAHDALVSVGVPGSVIQPDKDVLEERRTRAEQTYDPVKRLEQLTTARHKLAKRRDEQQMEFEEQKARLERAEQRLQQTKQDLDVLQTQIGQAMAETKEATSAAKRITEAPTRLRAARIALKQPDEELAGDPEYVKWQQAAHRWRHLNGTSAERVGAARGRRTAASTQSSFHQRCRQRPMPIL